MKATQRSNHNHNRHHNHNLFAKRRLLALTTVAAVSLLSNTYLIFLRSQSTSLPSQWFHDDDAAAAPTIGTRAGEAHHGTKRKTKAKRIMVPDWHHAVDCSAWDNMCAATSISASAVEGSSYEHEYEPYPFPLSRHVKNLDEFDHVPMPDVPADWQDALANKPVSVSYIYPPEVSKADREKCIRESTIDYTWQKQIDNLLDSGRVKREQEANTNMVAFTISDIHYAFDMMHDVFEMNSKVVGFEGSFFMIALDEETVEMACRYGYPAVAWQTSSVKQPDDNNISELKHAVANTKFEVSLYLINKGYDFFFYEMDVWFLKSPKSLIASYHNHNHNHDQNNHDGKDNHNYNHEHKHDILASSHMNDPHAINIGVYSVTANERTKEYFELCIQMARESPNTHDQWIMGQLLLLAWTINEHGPPGMKFNRMWYPLPEHNPPTMIHPPYYGLYNTMEIMAGERPYPTKNTIAIHTLCAGPLKKPFGKKIMAKELGVWMGFTGPDNGAGGYYARTEERRRYLWMDGHDSPSSYNTLQTFEWEGMNSESFLVKNGSAFRWTMAVLLSLARRTGRIFIMPKLIGEEGAHYLWTVLDFEPVEDMGIDFRETNFPHNKKSWHSESIPYASAARTALAPLKYADEEGTMYVQHPVRAPGGGGGVRGSNNRLDGKSEIKAWKFDGDMSEEKALDAWWALHTAIPEVDSAELLLVNPHFMSSPYATKLQAKMTNEDYAPSVAEKEIFDVYKQLKWCPGDPIVMKENVIGRSSAEMSCHGRGFFANAFAPGR